MPYEIVNFKIKGTASETSMKIDIASKCPHCFDRIKPHIIYKTDYDSKIKPPVAILFQCPSCLRYFVYSYELTGTSDGTSGAYITNLIPYTYKGLIEYDLPVELETISKAFKEIYTQSLMAETDGLSQITGIGYRKSIEFLLKDFLIIYQKEDAEIISKMPLSQAVDKLESSKIKSLAKASIWLGNDETHYVKKYEDNDVSDMKRFIRALGFFISSELTANEAQDFINQ